MVEQTFECSNCYEVFNKEHTTEVLWTQCPHCGGRAYPYQATMRQGEQKRPKAKHATHIGRRR